MKLSDVLDLLDDPSAFEFHYKGSKVEFLNEAGSFSDSSQFFVAGFEFGAHVLVHVESYRGDGFESAWGAWIDESETIPESELIEAYQVDGDTPEDMARKEIARAEENEGRDVPRYFSPEFNAHCQRVNARAVEILKSREDWELVEGYEYQSNFKGTGIVNVGHYAWMNEADLDEIEIVRKEENPSE